MAQSTSSNCNVCGSKRIDSNILICDSCTEYYCDDCSIQCDVVNPIHDTCMDCNISTSCSVCEMSFCNEHGSQIWCTDCDGASCHNHPGFYCYISLDNTGQCCGAHCESCDQPVCEQCYSRCKECGKDTCVNCAKKCTYCNQMYLCREMHHSCSSNTKFQ